MRKSVFAILLLMSVNSIAMSAHALARTATDSTKLIIWGAVPADRNKGWEAAFAEFERRHPGVQIRMLSMGAGGLNPQKLMTSIVGKVPPDVIYQDRFTIGDWASRGTFMPMDDLISRSREKKNAIRCEDYYPAAWNEVVYKEHTYAIPADVDNRALYYNRTLFRKAGLDPDRPPRTWDELRSYAKKLTSYDENGGYKQLGFIPVFGDSWFYLYSWQNNGEFMSTDGRHCTMNNPRSREALKWLVGFYNQLGGAEKLGAFTQGLKGNELDPFLVGQIAMKIDLDSFVGIIARYNPSIDFACAPAPVPTARFEGKPPFKGKAKYISWSGGYSWAIPKGAKNVKLGWEFIKWMESLECYRIVFSTQKAYNKSLGRPFIPYMSSNSRINEQMAREFGPKDPKFAAATQVFRELMPHSKFRPVTFVGQRLWDEHNISFDQAIRHKQTPGAALAESQSNVQRAMNEFLGRERYPLLNWSYLIGGICMVVVCVIWIIFVKRRGYARLSRMDRQEAVVGYAFASPWIFGFLVFTIGPVIASVMFSFCDYDVLHPARWVGLKNFCDLLTVDWLHLSKALYNVGYLTLFGLPLNMLVSLSIAMLLNTKVIGMKFYRTIYYLPAIMPVVANAILWIWILNPEYGMVNLVWRATFTRWFGMAAPLWLSSEFTSKPALILMGLWGAGGGMILWLAGLQGVPRALYEACDLDGAGWWARFINVTVPMLTPYIFFNLIMGTIGVLQSFEAQYIMTGGGPSESTTVPVLYLFNNAFTYFKMGYASAIAWLLFVIILALTLINVKMSKRWVYYDGQENK